MPYPDEIIAEILRVYSLTDDKLKQFRETLLADEIRLAIENFILKPQDLLIKPDVNSDYLFVLSPVAAKNIIDSPQLLEKFKNHLTSNIDKIKIWDEQRLEIEKIMAMTSSKQIRKKRQCAIDIINKLQPISRFLNMDDILYAEYHHFYQPLLQNINLDMTLLHKVAKEYFIELFKQEKKEIMDIEFNSKNSGIQLGTKMTLTYKEPVKSQYVLFKEEISKEKTITYYIKTHQNGSTSQTSSTQPIDLKELFIYKLLEFADYGPKTHFLFHLISGGGFFIATQDLGFTKTLNKHKVFTLFDEKVKACNIDPAAPCHEEARKGMIRLDIISRILNLADATTNFDNFGLVTSATDDFQQNKWKIFDFRINVSPYFYTNPEIMKGFKAGNGAFRYESSNFMDYIFKSVDYQSIRMALSAQIMDELNEGQPSKTGRKMSFLNALEKAHQEIVEYVSANSRHLNMNANALEDLTQFKEAVKQNFQALYTGIKSEVSPLSAAAAAEPQPKSNS